MIVMPPLPIPVSAMRGSGITSEADRSRLFSGVVVCDEHRKDATPVQILGPIGYKALTFAFRALKKKVPPMGDLAVDFESLERSPILRA